MVKTPMAETTTVRTIPMRTITAGLTMVHSTAVSSCHTIHLPTLPTFPEYLSTFKHKESWFTPNSPPDHCPKPLPTPIQSEQALLPRLPRQLRGPTRMPLSPRRPLGIPSALTSARRS